MDDTQELPRIKPVPEEVLSESLSEIIERLKSKKVISSTTPIRVWAHRPKLALAWLKLMECFYTDSTLDERLRELIRIRVAAATNCQACQLSRKSDTVTEADIACVTNDGPRFSKAERAAIDFAGHLAGDHDMISDKTFEALREEFSEEQIVEINMFSALMMAGGRMTFAQKAY